MASFLENALARKSENKSTSLKVNGVKFKLEGHVPSPTYKDIADVAKCQADIKLTFPKRVGEDGNIEDVRTDIVEDGSEFAVMFGLVPPVKVAKAANKGQ